MEIWHYITATGKDVYGDWFDSVRDEMGQARIVSRLERVANGNLGDCKAVGEGVRELRIDYGPGYRVYFGVHGDTYVLLLCAGDKRGQQNDIRRAIEYWKDFKLRNVTK